MPGGEFLLGSAWVCLMVQACLPGGRAGRQGSQKLKHCRLEGVV